MNNCIVCTPSEALQLLKDGNHRFVDGKSCQPNCDVARREEITSGQHPFATILTCSDSRVPPELIFDSGFGDLFVVRIAGNVLSNEVMASILYSVKHMNCPLVVVLGHESCGAVTEAINFDEDNTVMHYEITVFLKKLRENIPETLSNLDVIDDPVDAGARENVRTVTGSLLGHEMVASLVGDGACRVVPAYYSLSTGEVQWP